MFVVQLEEGLSYDMAVLGYSFDNELTLGDPTLTLYNINSNMLEFNDDGTGMGLDPSLEDFTAPYSGNYFIAVNAFSGGKGTYKVVVEESRPALPVIDDHANNLQTTSRLLVDETGSGTLETPGDEDIFVISLDENVSYSLSVGGLDSGGGSLVDPVFTVLDGDGNLLGGNDDGGIGLDPLIDSFIPTYDGDHFISVYAYDDSIGSYQIKAYATQDDHSDDPFNATRLELEDLSTYPVSTEGYVTPNDTDVFVIGMAPGNEYVLVVDTDSFAEKEDTSPFNSQLELYSPSGLSKLDSNNGTEEFKGSLLTFTPEVEGDYIIAVLASNEGEYGGYNIGVYEIPSII